MPRAGRSLKEAGGGDRPPHTHAKLPIHRAILWTPAEDGGAGADPTLDVRTYPMFIEHDALAGVNRHLVKEETEPRFGFLLGHLFYCPELGVNYAVVDTAVAARDVLSEEASGSFLIRAWSEAESVFAGHTGVLLGWYHSHRERSGLRLTEADRDTNSRYFDAPWQCAIVVVSTREPVVGAVFRHRGGTNGGGERPAPFHELLTGGEVDEARSAMAWTNYRSHRPIPAEGYRAAADAEPGGPSPEAPVPPPAPKKPRSARFSIVDSGRAKPDHRGVRPEEHPGSNPQLVIPGEGAETGLFSPRPGRRAKMSWRWPVRPGILVAVAVLVAALFILLPLGRNGESSGPEASGTPTPRAREATSPALRQFIELVDAVEIAGDRYAERAADFDAGRIGCDLLTTGYVAADEAYVRVAARYGEFGSDPNPRATSAYERAGSEMADVNRHFDGTQCPRP